ncbi:MAG TPA: hypothetical protein ENN67_05665, partial [Firmicutes bacterium]|nr:hypothetical protein [Bacillota bacterium]
MATVLKIPENPRILVADLAYIGDLLMSTPAITNLRKAFPSAVIDILVSSGTMPVIEHNPDINTVFTTDMKKRGLRGIREEARKISTMGYDIAISFHRAHGTLMMLRMSGISKRIGFTNGGRAFFLSSGVPFIIQKHRAWNHLRLLEKSFGIHVDYTTPTRLVPDSSAVETVRKRLESIKHKKGFIAVNPNAAWATKRWTPEGFADILY